MKISIEFNSLEEMREFATKMTEGDVKPEKAVKVKEKKQVKAEESKPEPEEEPKQEVGKNLKPEAAEEPKQGPVEEQKYTLEDVRAALRKVAATNKDKLKELLKSVGASNLTEVKEEDYAVIMKKVGE